MHAKLLVLLVVLAGAAGLVMWWSGGDGDPAPLGVDRASATDRAATPAASDAAPAAATLAPAGASVDAAADAGRIAAPVAASSTSGATVAVRGRLVDAAGQPRPGVQLTLHMWANIDGIELDLPLRERARAAAADRPTWTTRSDGRFEIPIAKDRSGSLDLPAQDLVFAKEHPPVDGRKGDQDLGDLSVLRSGTVQGVVRDERGQPVAGVKVATTIGSLGFATTSSSTTKEDGAFTLQKLRPGTWTLRTASGKFLPAVRELELAPEQQITDLVVVVKPGNAIAGQVVDDRGMGVAGMKVGSKRKESSGGVDIERFTPDEATVTDTNGYFTLAGLADETASVRAFGPGHTAATAADVQVGTGNLVLRVDRLGIVEGVLVGADGTPIAGSRVSSRSDGPMGMGADPLLADDLQLDGPGGRSVVTAADGSFRLDTVKPGAATIQARGKTHRPVRQAGVNVLPAQVTRGVRLIADLGATARVQVADDAGKPVEGALVRAERTRAAETAGGPTGAFRARAVSIEDHDGELIVGGGDRLASAVTDAEGLAVLGGLPAGDLTFSATHRDFAPAAPARVTTPKSGTVDTALALRRPGAAELVVLGSDGAPAAGVAVQVAPVDADGPDDVKRVTSGENGVVPVPGLAPGEYTAALSRRPGGARVGDAMVVVGDGADTIASSTQRFTVVAGETVRVELHRPVLARVHGVVSGGDGPVADCVVELARLDPDANGLPEFEGRSEVTGAEGAFAFDDVEAGNYELRFGKRDQVVKGRDELVVPANTTDLRRDLALRTGKLRLQVVAAGTGEPVAKAEVEIERAGATPSGGAPRAPRRVMMVSMVAGGEGGDSGEMSTMTFGAQRAFTDEDGLVEIEGVPAGEYDVRVKHRKHAPTTRKGQAVHERQTTDLGKVELAAAGLIRGKVLGADGKPPRMALVSSRPSDSPTWSEPQMAQGGNYRLQGLAAGRYKVRAQAIGAGPGTYSPEVDVDVKTGETATADLQLPGN